MYKRYLYVFRNERDIDGSYFTGTFENAGRDIEAAALAWHHHVGLVRSVELLVRTEV